MVTLHSYILKDGAALPVKVSVDISDGRGIFVSGLSDRQVKESLLRVVTALCSLGYRIPGRKIKIDIETGIGSAIDKCDVSVLDFPIAAAMLAAEGVGSFGGLALPLVGRLNLDGSSRKCEYLRELAAAALLDGFDGLVVPHGHVRTALVPEVKPLSCEKYHHAKTNAINIK